MSYYALKYHVESHVAVIGPIAPANSRRKVDNLAIELSDLCCQIGLGNDVRVFVLALANEKSFDNGEHSIRDIVLRNQGLETTLLSCTKSIAQLNQPIIAAINGDTIGFALELALACDIRIATDTAHFGFPHIKEGLIPWDGGTQRLSRVIGQAKAMEMVLTAANIKAEEAKEIGLVNKVVEPDKLISETRALMEKILENAPLGISLAKYIIRSEREMPFHVGENYEAMTSILTFLSKDGKEGMEAFFQKREPSWSGT